jgi:pyrroloquinoline quinone biosynthesis protein D
MNAGAAPAGTFGPTDIPRLSTLFRLQWEAAQSCHVLLYPEGMVRLNGPAGEILTRCNGVRSVAGIIAELSERFPEAPGLPADVYQFLKTAHEHQWITHADS